MKLNKQGKDELRAKIVEQLQNVPEGQRVHLDKALLEELIFEKYYILESSAENAKSNMAKVIVWSGDFLKKIDLSEVSFDSVIWNTEGAYPTDKGFLDDESFDKVNLSGTNVRIDFSKSFDALYPVDYYGNDVPVGTKHCVKMSNVNLANVDLSSSNFDYVGYIENCCLDYTKAPIKLEEPEEKMFVFEISTSSLKGIDLSHYTIPATNLFANMGQYYASEESEDDLKETTKLRELGIKPKRFFLSSCRLDDTGLNIDFTQVDMIIGELFNDI